MILRPCLLGLCLLFAISAIGTPARGQSVSQPAILQMFEAHWDTIENRMADIHQVGYGSMWVPPVARAGSVFSAGYDVFDRFDLGKPGDETHYGTETSFRQFVHQADRASVDVFPDLIINHNGFGNRTSATFVSQGGYPGFALTLPGVDINGDFHDPFLDWSVDPVNGQLFGLNDIAQEKNHMFIRHPIAPGPQNIPAGTIWNKPNAGNTRFYADQALGGFAAFNPETGQNVTLYDFNTTDPTAGDPILENAVGLLMRNVRWMIQEFGVDGFRVDAAKHSPEFTLDYIDQGVFRAIQELQHDGSIKPTFMFSEVADGAGTITPFIRRDLPNKNAISPTDTTIRGNRDALDFPLFWAMRDNLTGNGGVNNWHNIRAASIDATDRPGGTEAWHSDGSRGVAFVQSHDDFGAYLENVAHAYILMRPGNALVYLNAQEDGPTTFPKPGKVDALGGVYGSTITKLVDIRNSHGRGDFKERWLDNAFTPGGFSNVYIYERSNSAIVALNSRNDTVALTRNGVQTDFDPNDILVELTGNAADPAVDPTNIVADSVKVNGSKQINVTIPANQGHGRGYVIYGPSTPQGTLSLTNVASVLEGATPSASNNGTARLSDVHVVSSPTFDIRLNTTPVSVPNPSGAGTVRDFKADGDNALFRIDDGLDLNGNAGIDFPTPGDVNYGFEEFTDASVAGYISNGSGGNLGTGTGNFVQTIDTTQLSEGRHYINVRAFRHREVGKPAIFNEFRETIYVDLLPPDSQVLSFQPFPSHPLDTQDRNLIVSNPDGTAGEMYMFLDLPANLSEEDILDLVQAEPNGALVYDRGAWQHGMYDVSTGNHVATIVTIEPTGTTGIQRIPGMFTQTRLGAGFGDLDSSRTLEVVDIEGIGNGSFEDVLFSQNDLFNAAADLDGNGEVDNLDLFALEGALVTGGADQDVMDSYYELLVRRADINEDGYTNGNDVADLYAAFCDECATGANWFEDLNVDGIVDELDVEALVDVLVRTSRADFNLDYSVDGRDFLAWQLGAAAGSAGFHTGDSDLDGDADALDLATWDSQYGTQPLGGLASGTSVPEPGGLLLVLSAIAAGWQAPFRRGR